MRLYAESRPFFGLNLPTFISSNLLLQIQAQSPFLGSVMNGWSLGLLPRLSGRVLFWVRKLPQNRGRVHGPVLPQWNVTTSFCSLQCALGVFPGLTDSSVPLLTGREAQERMRSAQLERRLSRNARCSSSRAFQQPDHGAGYRVRGSLELQLLWGACRARGLFLTSSWGTTSPWLGVSDDCIDWQVDRLEI